ncbi:MAG TPA: hypothetical protein PK443_05525 [bacterium]|nr:hypothetical protein [bacterium]
MENHLLRWSDAIIVALQNFANDVILSLPGILAAIIVLILGLLLAKFLGRLTTKLIAVSRLDLLLEKTINMDRLKEKGVELKASIILGWAVKWFFIIVTFIAVADILGLHQLTNFFRMVAMYIPNVIIAILILLAGFILGDGLKNLVIKSVEVSSISKSIAEMLGKVSRIAVIVFAVMASLNQLGIASDLIRILFTGFVAMLTIAGGLAIGLGAKDHIREWLDKIRKGL